MHRYMLRQVMVPLLMTLGIAALLLLLERMLRIFDFVINEGGPFSVVWRLLGNMVPHYLGLALPIGFFLGIQLGFRRLSLTSELDAMQSAGIGLKRMLPPLLILALLLLAFNLLLAGFIQPFSRYAYANLAFEVQSGTLGASIKAGEFTRIGNGVTLRIEGSSDGGQTLDRLFIEKNSGDGRTSAITAQKGRFFATEDLSSLILRLEDGILVDLDQKNNNPRVLTFKTHDFVVALPRAEEFRDRGERTIERTFPELLEGMKGDGPEAAETRAAFHARVVRSIVLLAIPFFAIPLGVIRKRSSGTLGIAFGIIVMLLLHKILEFGEVYASLGHAPVWLTLWLPVALFFALSLRLFHISASTVGGEPLRLIEELWQGVMGLIGSLRKPKRRPA